MVSEAHVRQTLVVVQHLGLERLDTRLIFVAFVADDEASVELDNLSKAEGLTGRSVESAGGLNKLFLKRIVRSASLSETKTMKENVPSTSHSPARGL